MVNPKAISGAACIVKEGDRWQNQGELLRNRRVNTCFVKTNTNINKLLMRSL
jgi:hypothetical protein